MSRRLWQVAVIGLSMSLAATSAVARIVVDVGDGGTTSWTEAGDSIQPTDQLSWADERFYEQQAPDNFRPVMPTLQRDVSVPDENQRAFDSLLMAWDLPDNDVLAIANWEYLLGDPISLERSSKIWFSLLPPTGVWDVSLVLIDESGRSRGWFLPDPAGAGIANVWGQYMISPSEGRPQGLFTYFFSEPGFDIGSVVAIRLNESGMFSNPFPPLPGVTLPGWNAWNSLRVQVPSPAPLALMAIGLVALARRRVSA